jgi:hypothetical protein
MGNLLKGPRLTICTLHIPYGRTLLLSERESHELIIPKGLIESDSHQSVLMQFKGWMMHLMGMRVVIRVPAILIRCDLLLHEVM